jgi:hypothetical protein
MPIVQIYEQGPRNVQEKAWLVATLFEAIKDTLGVSPRELQARYTPLAIEDFFPPPCTMGYVAIEITLFAGRSLNAKRQLYARIAKDVAVLPFCLAATPLGLGDTFFLSGARHAVALGAVISILRFTLFALSLALDLGVVLYFADVVAMGLSVFTTKFLRLVSKLFTELMFSSISRLDLFLRHQGRASRLVGCRSKGNARHSQRGDEP